jgi:hypothetical protein
VLAAKLHQQGHSSHEIFGVPFDVKPEFVIHLSFHMGTMQRGTKPGTNTRQDAHNSFGAVLRMPAMMSVIRFQSRASC